MSKAGIPLRLYDLRVTKGLTQEDVANYLGITQTAYGKIEGGDRGLNANYCIRLAELYDTTCDYILRGIRAENVVLERETGLSDDAIQTLKRNNELVKQSQAVIDDNGASLDFDRFIGDARIALIDAVIRDESLAMAFSKLYALDMAEQSGYTCPDDLDDCIKKGVIPIWYAYGAFKNETVERFSALLDRRKE